MAGALAVTLVEKMPFADTLDGPVLGLRIYSNIETLVLPPGCRPTGRKLGQVRENWLCRWG